MDCSTVIVSYNTFALTREAVRTALASGAGIGHEVVVVDNASPDGSAARLAEAFAGDGRVTVIASAENAGFSAANNRGAAAASGAVLFFLNPDTVVHGDAVARLAAYLGARPDVGAVGPRVLNTDGTDQRSTSAFDSVGSVLRGAFGVPGRPPRRDRPSDVDVVNGCALAVRRDAFDAVGGWDEGYFMYAEENELCLALHRSGRANRLLPSAVITHHGGASSADRYVEHQLMAARNSVAFLRRHRSPAFVRFNRAAYAVGFGLRALAFPVIARLRPAQAEGWRLRGAAALALCRALVAGRA